MSYFRSIALLFICFSSLVGSVSSVAEPDSVPDQSDSRPPTLTSALRESIRLRSEIDRYRGQIAELETRFGPYSPHLLEPLWGLNEMLVQLQDFEAVDSNLNRLLMLIRTLEGLSSPDQIPVIEEAVQNDIRRQDWQSVTQRFEYLNLLVTRNAPDSPEALLESKDDLINWHLSAIYLDAPAGRLGHFMEAVELQRQNQNLAEATYGEDSPLLVPWLYRSAVQKYRVYSVLNADDELGLDARRAIIGSFYQEEQLARISEYLYSGIPSRGPRNYLEEELMDSLRDALNLVDRIHDILEAQGDPESEAMALVYRADFLLLMSSGGLEGSGRSRLALGGNSWSGRVSSGSAARVYRQAMDKMVEAGLSDEAIEEFFQRPLVIPEPRFYSSLDDAMAAQDSRGYVPAAENSGVIELGTFFGWQESVASAWRPEVPELVSNLPERVAVEAFDFQFKLNSRGEARRVKVIESSTDNARGRSEAREAIKTMQFRPVFEDRRWVPVDNLRLSYSLPAYH